MNYSDIQISFIKSTKGKDILIVNGFCCKKEKTISEKCIWRCELYEILKCKSRCHTRNGAMVFMSNSEHCHESNFNKIATRVIINELKSTAVKSYNTPQQLVSDSTKLFPHQYLPFCRNRKTSSEQLIELDKSITTFPTFQQLWHILRFLRIIERFLLFDNNSINNRLIIFSTQRNLDRLNANRNWYCDGTFKSTPNLFYQLYTIHVLYKTTSTPVVYCLL
ncbi:hypothetical protein HZS_1116 [Henneguya salminicola]|nr:hypothetical protein HZS_1116 [Henneguya salminicola]